MRQGNCVKNVNKMKKRTTEELNDKKKIDKVIYNVPQGEEKISLTVIKDQEEEQKHMEVNTIEPENNENVPKKEIGQRTKDNEIDIFNSVLHQTMLDTVEEDKGETATLITNVNSSESILIPASLIDSSNSIFTTTTTNAKTQVTLSTVKTLIISEASDVSADNIVENSQAISLEDQRAQQESQRTDYKHQIDQLYAALVQKENMIALFQRENTILEKEKMAFRKEKELANKEKEATVIKFAMQEKLLLDAKKEKEAVEKQLIDAKKEIKNISIRFQALTEEKSRISYIMDEKCNEVRKFQRECEKLKIDQGHLESKLKYHVNKLQMEVGAKQALEKKLEEERNSPSKMEKNANEKFKMEYEANTILLKHEIERKTEMLDNLTKDINKLTETNNQLQRQLSKEITEKMEISNEFELFQEEHNSVQNAYSEEMLNSAKLRGQLDELQLLKTQNSLNEEKIHHLNLKVDELLKHLEDDAEDLKQLHSKEEELLSINKEMSELIVVLQNEICLVKAKSQGIETENNILKKDKLQFDTKYSGLESQLKRENQNKAEERQLLTKLLSEKTKLYEITKMELENILGELEAMKNKHATVIKELQRELQKYKKSVEHANHSENVSSGNDKFVCINCAHNVKGYNLDYPDVLRENVSPPKLSIDCGHSCSSSRSGDISSRQSDCSESETIASSATAIQNDLQTPCKKYLVERILRLQKASVRQTEKIDFLENHSLSLVTELQKKSKVVQYYMLRDEAGALTTSRSDQNKTELAKYGNGVMCAIYNGIKSDNKCMTLELSLEINKKLQTVLEDTLLKNITLKENLDVLGLEVDNLTRRLRQLEAKD